jgi:hypothetical protein
MTSNAASCNTAGRNSLGAARLTLLRLAANRSAEALTNAIEGRAPVTVEKAAELPHDGPDNFSSDLYLEVQGRIGKFDAIWLVRHGLEFQDEQLETVMIRASAAALIERFGGQSERWPQGHQRWVILRPISRRGLDDAAAHVIDTSVPGRRRNRLAQMYRL